MAAWLALLLIAFLAPAASDGPADEAAAAKICIAPMDQPCPAPLVDCLNPTYGPGCAPNMPLAVAGRGPVGLA